MIMSKEANHTPANYAGESHACELHTGGLHACESRTGESHTGGLHACESRTTWPQ